MPATLLIVDDESLLRWSLRERFAKDGHTILEAGTAVEALDQTVNGVDLEVRTGQVVDRSCTLFRLARNSPRSPNDSDLR